MLAEVFNTKITMDIKKLEIALNALVFRDIAGNIYECNNTNQMVLEIAKQFGIVIKKQVTTKENDENISLYRKIFKNER